MRMGCCSGRIFKCVGMVIAMGAVFGLAVMFLWNGLIPKLFNGPVVTFYQAVGLLVLAHVLFRGAMGWGCCGGGGRRDHWRKRFEEKMAAMTPEEREKFKQKWQQCCGWGEGEEETKEKGKEEKS